MKKGAELGGNGEEEKGNEGAADSYSALKSKKNSRGDLVSATSDDNLKEILREVRTSKLPAVINYGASWCGVCSQILPTFCELSGKFPKVSFVYADIDECPETTQHIRYSTRPPLISTEMVKELMRCLVSEKSVCGIASGCILE